MMILMNTRLLKNDNDFLWSIWMCGNCSLIESISAIACGDGVELTINKVKIDSELGFVEIYIMIMLVSDYKIFVLKDYLVVVFSEWTDIDYMSKKIEPKIDVMICEK